MTLQDLGNLGELVGAIGVVASLIYLAVQIRQNSRQITQNTNSVQVSVELENARLSSDWLVTIAQDPHLARVWRDGLARPETLTEEEGIQFAMLMGSAFYRLEGPFRQYRRGLLSEDSWKPWEELISRYMRSPAVQEWWSRRDVPFAKSFADYVDSVAPASAKDAGVAEAPVLPSVWRGPAP